MKRYTLALLVLVVVFSVPMISYAFNIFRPFGGKVLTVNVPGIICNGGYGPITIVPAGLSSPGPYAVDFNTEFFETGIIRTGGYILGLYNPIISLTTCRTIPIPPAPPIPIPVFVIKLFGSS